MSSEDALIEALRQTIKTLEREKAELLEAIDLMRKDNADYREALSHYANHPPPHPLCADNTVHPNPS